jgi:hypothetical protein
MFNQPVDDRLTEWITHRRELDESTDPLQDVWDFWHRAPFVPLNKNIDPYYQKSWPTPWEIIENNKYDDFTKALMIAYTLKFTKKFTNNKIDIRMCIDKEKSAYYNIVCIDDIIALNYRDLEETSWNSLPKSFLVENVIEVASLR